MGTVADRLVYTIPNVPCGVLGTGDFSVQADPRGFSPWGVHRGDPRHVEYAGRELTPRLLSAILTIHQQLSSGVQCADTSEGDPARSQKARRPGQSEDQESPKVNPVGFTCPETSHPSKARINRRRQRHAIGLGLTQTRSIAGAATRIGSASPPPSGCRQADRVMTSCISGLSFGPEPIVARIAGDASDAS